MFTKSLFAICICLLVVGFQLVFARKTYQGRCKLFGVVLPPGMWIYVLFSVITAAAMFCFYMPGILFNRDSQAPVGIFFLGLTGLVLLPLFVFLGRGLNAAFLLLHNGGNCRDKNQLFRYCFMGLLVAVGLCVIVFWRLYNFKLMEKVSNPNASADVLRKAQHKAFWPGIDYQIRLKIAEHRNTPDDLLEDLAESGDLAICMRVAANQSTGIRAVRHLATNKDFWVRVCVARRGDCPEDILERLNNDPSAEVRQEVRLHVEKKKR
ncbi:MAG: hypothetical protein PHV34_04355 [Verrucomicrobiae bacterium]|nr:hypothetical protein [Verrucomicrobiae bacterium]